MLDFRFRLNSFSRAIHAGSTSYDPATEALVARFTTPPTTQRKDLIDGLIVSLKAAGVWTKLDVLRVMAAADAQAAQRNWVADQYNATPVFSPTFTVDRGYKGNGSTSYLNSGFNPSTASGKTTLNSAHIGMFHYEDTETTTFHIGNLNSTLQFSGSNAGYFQGRLNGGVTQEIGQQLATSVRHHVLNRSLSSSIDLYVAGVKIVSGFAQDSTSMANANMLECARDTGGGIQYGSRGLAVVHYGSALSDAEVAAMSSALTTYLTGVGVI